MAILNDGTKVFTKEFNGQIGCSTTAPKLSPPKYSNGVIYHLDDRPFTFLPFTTSNSDFPACGFKEYTVTAYNKVTRRSHKVEYPPKDNKVVCKTLKSCLQAKFDTSQLGTITVTISATTFEPRTVKASFDLTIKPCSPIKDSYPISFTVDAARPGTPRYKL
jgi:hypothetical protein